MTVRKTRKITPDLDKEILAKAALGESAQSIADWLREAHGIKISRQAITQRLKATRVERAEVAKAVTREALSKTVVSDLDGLDREQAKVRRLSRRLHRVASRAIEVLEKKARAGDGQEVNLEEVRAAVASAGAMARTAIQASDSVGRLLALRLRLSGAEEEPGGDDAREAQQLLRSRIDSLAAELRKGSSSGEAGSDGG